MLEISKELPKGTTNVGLLKAIKGRIWGENAQRVQQMLFDVEHGVIEVEVRESDQEYAFVQVSNKREPRDLVWLVGRSADKENMFFVHPLWRSNVRNLEDLINQVLRKQHGFSKMIQGDVIMGTGHFVADEPWVTKLSLFAQDFRQRDETAFFVIGNMGRRIKEWTDLTSNVQAEIRPIVFDDKKKLSDILLPGGAIGGHQVTCPKGLFRGVLSYDGGQDNLPVLVCMGNFSITHAEHGETTIEVPGSFHAILALQDEGINQNIHDVFVGVGARQQFD